jgi:hypothetical protein
VAFLFVVRKFPIGKSEFSGLLFQAIPGKVLLLFIHRGSCLVLERVTVAKLFTVMHRVRKTGSNAGSLRQKRS